MNLIEKTLSEKTVYTGKIISMRVDEAMLSNGHKVERELITHPGGVCVAALTENNELLFVRQFRYPYNEVLLELPAGKLSPGEDPLECGIRELKEETGATADHYESLGELYPSPGYCSEIIHLYHASKLTLGKSSPDDDEFLEVEFIPFQQAVQMVLQNKITDAKTQTAILKLALLKK